MSGNGTIDDNDLPEVATSAYPLIAPTSSTHQAWTTTITSISGSNLTLASSAPASATSVVTSHDDQAAFQAAVNAVCATGGTVVLNSG
ncbi:MAG: hypothetical protein WB580_15295, partial [Candidatus Binataceae bacterium]